MNMVKTNGKYGEEVWESKIKSQDEIGVIGGSRVKREFIENDVKRFMGVLDKEVLPLIKPKSKILDAGCGPLARFSIEFAKRGHKVFACDISDTTLRYALHHAKGNKKDIQFIKDDLTQLKNIPSEIDFVFCYATFYHIPPHLEGIALIRFYEKLKQGGLCLIEFGVQEKKNIKQILFGLFYWAGHYFKSLFGKGFNVNVTRLNPAELKELIHGAGFKIEKKFNKNLYLLRK